MILTPLETLILVSLMSFIIVYVYIVYIKHAFKIFKSYFSEWNECFLCLGFWVSLFNLLVINYFNYKIDYLINPLHTFFLFLFIVLGSFYSYKTSTLFNFVKERSLFPFTLGKFGLFLSLSFPLWMTLFLIFIVPTNIYFISYSVASAFLVVIYKKFLEALDEKN